MSLRAQRGNLAATSTNAVASFRLSPMSLRPQRGNPVATSTDAVASFRLSPNVIASAARQYRSHMDQRCRQVSVAPKCHYERSAAISQPHRPTLSPASDCPPMSLRPQRGNLAAASTNAVASFRLSPNLGFTQFKRRRQGNLQVGGTERPGVPECRGQRPTVRNLPTPATGGV